MMELIMQLNCQFTDADKEKCLPTIHTLMELAKLARMKGILAVEKEAQQMSSLFLKTALLLVADGREPVVVKQILQNLILADKYSGSQLLERLLITEGVLSLQNGENPQMIEMKLRSMLGEKYLLITNESTPTINEKMKKYNDCLRAINGKIALPESAQFESIFLHLDNRSLQHIIRSTDIQNLTLALNGCGFNLIHKILQIVSTNVCLQICENLELNKPLHNEYIIAAQKRVINVFESLVDIGEIIAPISIISNIGNALQE